MWAVLEQAQDWYSVYEDQKWKHALIKAYNYNQLRNLYDDIQIVKEKRSSFGQRVVAHSTWWPRGAWRTMREVPFEGSMPALLSQTY